jgi:putative membrane protein insertion efficiency factor
MPDCQLAAFVAHFSIQARSDHQWKNWQCSCSEPRQAIAARSLSTSSARAEAIPGYGVDCAPIGRRKKICRGGIRFFTNIAQSAPAKNHGAKFVRIPQLLLVFMIRLYQWLISPAKIVLFGSAGCCRFTPSCSEYALQAVKIHGAARGVLMALKRIARCHPWGRAGDDPVPARLSDLTKNQTRNHNLQFKTAR